MDTGKAQLKPAHEGARIASLLFRYGKTVADLAQAAGKSWPAANRYVKSEVLNPRAWQSCSQGLARLGIDPRLIRGVDGASQLSEFNKLLVTLSDEQLKDLRAILNLDLVTLARLVDWIDGRLSVPRESHQIKEPVPVKSLARIPAPRRR